MRNRPKLGVFKFASCDGCQLSILDCEDELLAVAGAVEIAYFPEATRREVKGPYEISLVEGSITTPDDAMRIHQVRRSSRILVAIGACATSGGIQALRNFGKVSSFVSAVYANPSYIETLKSSTPIDEHIKVDLLMPGCPISKDQLVELIASLIKGKKPVYPDHSLCIECKKKGIACLMVARGIPCMGPVTRAGCGVLCPSYSRGCYGCFGPKENPNTESLSEIFAGLGIEREERIALFRNFNAWAEPFRKESEANER